MAIAGQPIHSMLAQFPNVCFTLTLLTDITYRRTTHLMGQEFSSWLLFAGLVFGALALIAGLIDFLFRSTVRAPAPAWQHAVGGVVVLALTVFNSSSTPVMAGPPCALGSHSLCCDGHRDGHQQLAGPCTDVSSWRRSETT